MHEGNNMDIIATFKKPTPESPQPPQPSTAPPAALPSPRLRRVYRPRGARAPPGAGARRRGGCAALGAREAP